MHITLIIWLLHPAFLLFTCSCTLIFASCTIRKISVSSGGEIISAYSFDKLAGYEDQSEEIIRKTGDDLADLINFSEVSIDDIMRTMGIPEPMIPILKEQMREAMKTPEFWQQYKAANPTVDTSKWPKEIRERFDKQMKGN